MNSFFEYDVKSKIAEEKNNRKSHFLWVEKYRPFTLNGFVGNSYITKQISEYIKKNDIPHLLLHGSPGCGKSTLAKIIVTNINCDHIYINASDENGIDTVRDKIKTFVETVGLTPLKVVILDEFDFMTVNAQSALRNMMEAYSENSRFILTCNYKEKIIEPIQSRCQVYNLENFDFNGIMPLIKFILKNENIEYDTSEMTEFIKQMFPDIRKIINSLQKNSMTGKLIINSIDKSLDDIKSNIIAVIKSNAKKEDKLKQIRQFIINNGITDFIQFYRYLYDNVDDYSNGKSINVILILAEMEYKYAFVVDKEINFSACILQILNTI